MVLIILTCDSVVFFHTNEQQSRLRWVLWLWYIHPSAGTLTANGTRYPWFVTLPWHPPIPMSPTHPHVFAPTHRSLSVNKVQYSIHCTHPFPCLCTQPWISTPTVIDTHPWPPHLPMSFHPPWPISFSLYLIPFFKTYYFVLSVILIHAFTTNALFTIVAQTRGFPICMLFTIRLTWVNRVFKLNKVEQS